MDRNQIIGFSLLALLLIGFFSYNSYNKAQFEKYNQHAQDSFQRAQRRKDSLAGGSQQPTVPTAADSQRLQLAQDSFNSTRPGGFQKVAASIVKLENKDIKLEISTAGATPVSALLKDYRTYDSTPLYFFKGPENLLSLGLPNVQGAATTADLNFTAQPQASPASATFTADLGNGRRVDMTYTLPAEGYMMQCSVKYSGIPASSVPLRWITFARHTEREVANERTTAQIYYRYKNEDHDYYTIRDGNESKSLDEGAAQWVGFRMHYFSTALVADDNGMSDVKVASTVKLDSNTVAKNDTRGTIALKGDGTANLRWYIGPNHYQTLRSYKIGLDEMVPLGFGFFSFVKYINKWLIIPVFNVLNSTGMNMGIIIMILTIFIRLILSFFTYKSYLSSAKMRVLKPEIDALRAKYGSDQQQFGMEQMKLYRSAGVSPLGGCLPTLFQIPILFAMYYFFPSSIELRQKSFLWAHDLSTYDSIASWTTNVPLLSSVYGNHVSLFTLLMTASSLFLALYNRNMTAGAQPDNPVMKYMPFVFPIILMGVFNKMAAALTFYYFFSNCISILQQFIIQKFVIDEKKIHAQMQEARNKPATPSKWQAKLEEMQKMQAERGKKK